MDFGRIWEIYGLMWSPEPYIATAAAAVLLLAALFLVRGRTGLKWSRLLPVYLLAADLLVVFTLTVTARMHRDCAVYMLDPFWLYRPENVLPRAELVLELAINLCMLLPVGLLFPIVLGARRCCVRTVLFGMCVSLTVETMQYVLKRGTFDLSDIFHNTLGAAIGYVLYRVCSLLYRQLKRDSSVVHP